VFEANGAAADEVLEEIMQKPQTQFVRIWRGRTPRARADEYERYNYDAGIRPLIDTALAVSTFRLDTADYSEFTTISYWPDIESMRRFTGREPTAIHHLPRDPEFLIELPKEIEIHELRTARGLDHIAARTLEA
jgi:hypothetical protein